MIDADQSILPIPATAQAATTYCDARGLLWRTQSRAMVFSMSGRPDAGGRRHLPGTGQPSHWLQTFVHKPAQLQVESAPPTQCRYLLNCGGPADESLGDRWSRHPAAREGNECDVCWEPTVGP